MDSMKEKVINLEHLAIEKQCMELVEEGLFKCIRNKKGVLHFLDAKIKTPEGFTDVK